ncbi:MAG: Npun_R2479 family HD domain-containing metalloprotein [Coleofasciculus sp.]
MFNPTDVLIQTCVTQLQAGYLRTYGYYKPDYANLITQVANLALTQITRSNALYHTVEHTILATLVGQEILRGKHLREGNVSPKDWLHCIISLLCHDIGYVKGICHPDKINQRQYATGINQELIILPLGATDASLAPYHVDRGKLFIKEYFGGEDLIDIEVIQRYLELTRFPVPADNDYQDTVNYPGLIRAADLIGQLSDPQYLQKLTALFYELAEIGTHEGLGYHHPADLRQGYPKFFWNLVYPYIQTGLHHLQMTGWGEQIIANLYTNVFVVEKELLAAKESAEHSQVIPFLPRRLKSLLH